MTIHFHTNTNRGQENSMERWWFNSMLFKKELARRCGLNKSMDSLGPIENTGEIEDSNRKDTTQNIQSCGGRDDSSYSNVDRLVDFKDIWTFVPPPSFLVKDTNGDSFFLYFDSEKQSFEIDNNPLVLSLLECFYGYPHNKSTSEDTCSNNDTQSSWNNYINRCIESYLQSEISIATGTSVGSDINNWVDSYIYRSIFSESRNNGETEGSNDIEDSFSEDDLNDIEDSFNDIEDSFNDIEDSFNDIEDSEDDLNDIEDSFNDIEAQDSELKLEDSFNDMEDHSNDGEDSFNDSEDSSNDREGEDHSNDREDSFSEDSLNDSEDSFSEDSFREDSSNDAEGSNDREDSFRDSEDSFSDDSSTDSEDGFSEDSSNDSEDSSNDIEAQDSELKLEDSFNDSEAQESDLTLEESSNDSEDSSNDSEDSLNDSEDSSNHKGETNGYVDYSHLWVQCDNCYGLNYKQFFLKKLYICEHCGWHLKMNSSDRLDLSIDPDTWDPMDDYLESTDPIEWAAEDEPSYKERLHSYQITTGLSEAVQVGIGELNGIPVAIGVMDFAFIGGSMGSVVGEKIACLIEYATNQLLPLIIVCASGGARMQEGSVSLMQMAKISSLLYDYQINKKLFYISILASPTTGGVTASFGMLGDIIIAEPNAYIAFAGKRVIEETLKIEVPEGVQETEYLFEKGAFDLIVPRQFLKTVLTELLKLHAFFPLTEN